MIVFLPHILPNLTSTSAHPSLPSPHHLLNSSRAVGKKIIVFFLLNYREKFHIAPAVSYGTPHMHYSTHKVAGAIMKKRG